MSEFSGYSSKSAAVRGLGRFLGVASRNNPDLDVASLIEQVDGKFGFYHDKANAAVGLDKLDEADEALKLSCGHVNCPHCGSHLSNGIGDFDGLVDRHGEVEAYKMQKHEWACLGCNGEWGAEIPAPTKRKASTKAGPSGADRARSNVEKPSEIVFRLADADPKGARKDIVAKAIAEGVTVNTANAAYQHWRKARGLTKARG